MQLTFPHILKRPFHKMYNKNGTAAYFIGCLLYFNPGSKTFHFKFLPINSPSANVVVLIYDQNSFLAVLLLKIKVREYGTTSVLKCIPVLLLRQFSRKSGKKFLSPLK